MTRRQAKEWDNMNTKLYAAYGSNLNMEQMAHRCPSARIYGSGKIHGAKLVFNGVATIVADNEGCVPVGVWEIDRDCEASLDRYEGYPHLYHKELIYVQMYDGKWVKAMVYVMNNGDKRLPSPAYYDIIKQGYEEIGLDLNYLKRALQEASE